MKFIKKTIIAAAAALISLSAAAPSYHEAFAAVDLTPGYVTSTAAPAAFANDKEAADYLRECMVKRMESVTISVPNTNPNSYYDIYELAQQHTGAGNEGDYIFWQRNGTKYGSSVSGGTVTIIYKFEYTSTAEQEDAVTKKLQQIYSDLNLVSLNNYQKIEALYNYVTTHVVYADYPEDIDYTPYGALFNGRAVCQGVSILMYRMLLDNGIDARLIAGRGNSANHGWNIVQLDGLYYNIDATWDIGGYRTFFLKGSQDFDLGSYTHTRNIFNSDGSVFGIDFTSDEFNKAYPMSLYAYDPDSAQLPLGDINCDGKINPADATAILNAYTRKASGGSLNLTDAQVNAGDIDRNGILNPVDATDVLAYYTYAASTSAPLSISEYFSITDY